jgi:hypothetical protein
VGNVCNWRYQQVISLFPYRSFLGLGELLGVLSGLLLPGTIPEVLGSIPVEGCVGVGSVHHVYDLLDHFGEPLGGCPLVARFDHVLADLTLVADVRVVDLGLERNHRGFEREVVQDELKGELTAFECRAWGTSNVDLPHVIRLFDDNVLLFLKINAFRF